MLKSFEGTEQTKKMRCKYTEHFLFKENDTEFHKSHSKWTIAGVFHQHTLLSFSHRMTWSIHGFLKIKYANNETNFFLNFK